MSHDAASIMTTPVVSVREDDAISAVARVLADHAISAVPVCDRQGKIVGMISEGDLMKSFGRDRERKRAWWLDLLAEGTDLAPEFVDYVRQDWRRASDVMTSPVVMAAVDTPLADVADMLMKHQIKRVPIVADGKLLGIVSRGDLVRAAYAL